MDAESLKELFAPFGAVAIKRMFGGHGIYADGVCFAIEADGEVYLKTDDETKGKFVAVGSGPMIYEAKGRAMEMSYWRLPPGAYDDDEELKSGSRLALATARRKAAVKTKPARRKRR
jgi:DNA transformation protein and related proteins